MKVQFEKKVPKGAKIFIEAETASCAYSSDDQKWTTLKHGSPPVEVTVKGSPHEVYTRLRAAGCQCSIPEPPLSYEEAKRRARPRSHRNR